MKLKKEHLTILIILITEILGFSLILPFLPFYAQEFGATPLQIGLLLTAFSLFQFFSSPILGKISDYYGRKPLLIISQFSTFISFIILGFANSLEMLYLSRIVDGLFGSNYTIAQAYLSDTSTKEERSKVFGLSGVAFGFGFLVGPGIGGYLSQFGYQVPSFLAALISLIPIILIFFFLPETIQKREGLKLDWKLFHFRDFKKYLTGKKFSSKIWQFTAYIFSHVIWVSTGALFAQKQLGFTAVDMGYLLAYIGLISIIIRGLLLSKLIHFFGEHRLQYIGFISIIIGMIATVFVTEGWVLYFVLTLFSFGSGVLRPIVLGDISRNSSEKEQGAVLGVTNSMGSITQMIGPLVGGFMINYFFPGSLGIVAAFMASIGLLLLIREDAMKRNK